MSALQQSRDRTRTRPKVSDEIISSIRSAIRVGTYPRGERLPSERELAEIYGVSQPTIREAIRALDAMGLIEVRHGSGAYVAADIREYVSTALSTILQIESVGLLETLEVREALGRYSARRVVRFATAQDVADIERAAQACGAAANSGDALDIANSIFRFQDALARASHNPLLYSIEAYLIRLLMKLQVEAKTTDALNYWKTRAEEFQEDRLAIARLIANRDEDHTVEAMLAYLGAQRRMFASDPDLLDIRLETVDLDRHIMFAP